LFYSIGLGFRWLHCPYFISPSFSSICYFALPLTAWTQHLNWKSLCGNQESGPLMVWTLFFGYIKFRRWWLRNHFGLRTALGLQKVWCRVDNLGCRVGFGPTRLTCQLEPNAIINQIETCNSNTTWLTCQVTRHDTIKLTSHVDTTGPDLNFLKFFFFFFPWMPGNHGFCFKIFTFFKKKKKGKKKKVYSRVVLKIANPRLIDPFYTDLRCVF